MPSIKDIYDADGFEWRYPLPPVSIAFITSVSNNLGRLIISPVLPDMIITFDTSKSIVGLALSGMWATYALLEFPSGVLGDRFGSV